MGVYCSCDAPCSYIERTSIEDNKEVESLETTIKTLNTKVEVLQLESYYKSRLIENLTKENDELKTDSETSRRRLS